jgi:hypothetical protein
MDGCCALLELPAGERIDQGPRIGLGERSPHGGTVAECDRQTSALDLIGVGLTIFCGPDSGEVTPPTLAGSGGRLPVVSHVVDADTAVALGIEYAGALAVRSDGRPLLSWPQLPADPSTEFRSALAATRPRFR